MTSGVPVGSPRFNIGASTRDWIHEVRLVRGCLEGQIERLDRLERELVALLDSRAGGVEKQFILDQGHVAHNLHLRPCSDGSLEISIDGGSKLALGPRLAEVFQLLASGNKDSSGKDPLVGWRSRAEISKFLQGAMGRSTRASYVNNLVHLLRKALRSAGYDRSLIQTHRQKGVRFALKGGDRGLEKSSLPDLR